MNSDTMEEAMECAEDAGAIVKCSECREYRDVHDEDSLEKAVEIALDRRNAHIRGFRGMPDSEVREAIKSAIQEVGDCRCQRLMR